VFLILKQLTKIRCVHKF